MKLDKAIKKAMKMLDKKDEVILVRGGKYPIYMRLTCNANCIYYWDIKRNKRLGNRFDVFDLVAKDWEILE